MTASHLDGASFERTRAERENTAGVKSASTSTARPTPDVGGGHADRRTGADPEAGESGRTAISGIGPWTVQGALIIALGREDVVLPGDLALRKTVRAAYRLDHLPSPQEVLAIADKWRPYRSLATSYLFSDAYEPSEVPPAARNRSAGT